jgi:hypothetical protein
MPRSHAKIIVGACVLALVAPVAAHADTTQTFPTSQSPFDPDFAGRVVRNQGWWSPTVANHDDNDNYFVGQLDHPLDGPHRNFFTFDLSSACQAKAVILQLSRFVQSGPVTYSLSDVSTPAATLNDNVGTSQAIFDDLGTGTTFGSFEVGVGDRTDVLSFDFNAAAVAAFNAARGNFFSVGGRLDSPVGSYLFAESADTPHPGTQQLLVTCGSVRPKTFEDCKDDGWRRYDGFTNQGDCVSYVATHGGNGPGH